MRTIALAVLAVTLLAGCEGRSSSAAWILDPAYEITAETTDLHLIAQQKGCAYGGPPVEERVMPPEISYANDAISVTIRIRILAAGCFLTPPFPLVVQLAEPVGSRVITHGAGGTDIQFLSTPPTT